MKGDGSLKDVTLGIRVHDIKADSFPGVLDKVKQYGFKRLHLAPAKVETLGMGTMNPEQAKDVEQDLISKQMSVSILGCYVNLAHPEETERQKAVFRFENSLQCARWLDNAIVATETGSITDQGYTTKNFTASAFRKVVQSVKEIDSYARSVGALYAIEPGINHPIYSLERLEDLVSAIDSPNLRVIFDPVNLMTEKLADQQQQLITNFFDLFASRIVAFHLKDFTFKDGIKEVIPFGQGELDKKFYLQTIAQRCPQAFCSFEGIKESELSAAIKEVTRWVNIKDDCFKGGTFNEK